MNDEYVWDRSGEPDPFARALEQRLAPLDEAEAIIASLELDVDADADDDGAQVVYLHVSPERPAPRQRAWPWLAAALLLLTASVGLLVSAARAPASTTAEVAGATAGRIVIEASDAAVIVALRPTHTALARCLAAHPPAAPLALHVELPSIASPNDDPLTTCIHAALEPELARTHAGSTITLHLR